MTDSELKTSLENEIEDERSKLADTLSSLVDDFQPAALIEKWEEQAPELAQKAVNAAKDHPLAVGVIGAGLTMLAVGASQSSAKKQAQMDSLRRTADDAKDTVGRAQVRARETATEMRTKLYDGTAELSDVARARVVAAREKAIEAQARIEEAARRTAHSAQNASDSQWLTTCAGIAAVAAAAAFALPRTKVEDDTFGSQRDALADQAEAIFREEMDRAVAQGRDAIDAAQQALRTNGAADHSSHNLS